MVSVTCAKSLIACAMSHSQHPLQNDSESAPEIHFQGETLQEPRPLLEKQAVNLQDAARYKGNHFSPKETNALYANFVTHANFSQSGLTLEPIVSYNSSFDSWDESILQQIGVSLEMTKTTSTFTAMFPFFMRHPELEKPFFQAVTSKDMISFKQYLRFMSIVARGTQTERLELAIKVIARGQTTRITKEDFLIMVRGINIFMEENGHSSQIEPDIVADSLFCHHVEKKSENVENCKHDKLAKKMKRLTRELYLPPQEGGGFIDDNTYKQLMESTNKELQQLIKEEQHLGEVVDSLSYESFVSHAKKVASFATCFGLFSMVYRYHIKPVLMDAKVYSGTGRESVDRWLSTPGSMFSGGTPGSIASRVFSESPFSSKPVAQETEDEMAKPALPYHKGRLFTKKWLSRRDVHMLVEIRNGFMLFYDENREKSTPWQVLVLHDACAQPLNHDEQHAKEFLLTVKLGTGKVSRVFVAESAEERNTWIDAIAASAEANLPEPNRFHSFAPVHKDVATRVYTCGRDYFADLAENLKVAKSHILMTAWHFTPQLYLTRNPKGNRLDEILLERAEAGVKVYILVWKDRLVNLASKKVKEVLKHKNIFVIRDPARRQPFYRLWTHHQKMVTIDGAVGYVGGIDVAIGRYDTPEYKLLDEDEEEFPGLDYANQMAGYDKYGDHIDRSDFQDRAHVPRMPWQDVHCKVLGPPVLDLERNFIQRWEASRPHDEKHASWIIIPEKEPQKPVIAQDIGSQKCSVQILRSVASWSFDFVQTEHSMYTAQLKAIRNAKRFIFIENQFFISASDPGQVNPKNLILKALVDRVVEAHEKGEEFRIIMLHPQQPCSSLTANPFTRTVLYWKYASLRRGDLSFWKALINRVGKENAKKYVTMSSLQNYGRTRAGLCLTEIVYIHAKVMIVDDNVAFISSHNINDRSFLGNRDSEIGLVVEDEEKVNVPFGNSTLVVGKFAHDLRMDLFRTFLGLKEDKSEDKLIEDPMAAFSFWNQRGKENLAIYLDVFKKIHHSIDNLSELHYISNYDVYQRVHTVRTEQEYEKLKQIQGFVVWFPKRFLEKSWFYPAVESHVDAPFV